MKDLFKNEIGVCVPAFLNADRTLWDQENQKLIREWAQGKEVKSYLVAASPKSQVYKVIVENRKSFIYKHFSLELHFFKESFALDLFHKENFVPKLIDRDEKAQFLILEYIASKPELKHADYLDQIAYNLGVLHSYSEKIEGSYSGTILGIKDEKLYQKAIRLIRESYGEYNPITLGEFLPHHVLLTKTKCVFVDMDLFSIGFPDYFDLLGFLTNRFDFFRLEEDPWKRLLKSYLEGKYQRKVGVKEVNLNYKIVCMMVKSMGGPHTFMPAAMLQIGNFAPQKVYTQSKSKVGF